MRIILAASCLIALAGCGSGAVETYGNSEEQIPPPSDTFRNDLELVQGPAADAGAPPPAPPAERASPRAALASYASADDYPASALRNEEQGRVGFDLDIGADGRVANCTVTASSGSASLDSASCRIMRSRARFTPARDAKGDPAPDRVQGELNWTLPAD